MSKLSHIQFRPGRLAERLLDRARIGLSPARVAQRDLDRYYLLVDTAARRLPFSEAEVRVLLGGLDWLAIEGLIGDAAAPLRIPAEVADWVRIVRERSIETDDAELFGGVDADRLARKVAALGVGELYALADLAERYWAVPDRDLRWVMERM